ncbi:ATP-binding protein [Pollutimonas bauzanensis]|uniref:Predicted ATPase n=1 Tax=Pollutimonas bauzanensis TaxID=658167 RepID=A0A1M6C2C7_9BURK|nr:AAA family ATPase [Pollutimonas bauzanensis]SHI54971.1 Predicted ATPase [Pollutimonas bauzanensis]
MKIKLNTEYKSIKYLNEIDLPNFVILTGLNGAGKSQLLQSITSKKTVLEDGEKVLTKIKTLSDGLGAISSTTFYGSDLERFCIETEQKITSFNYHKKNFPQSTYNFESYFSNDEKHIIRQILKSGKKGSEQDLGYITRSEILQHVPPDYVAPKKVKQFASPDLFQMDLSRVFKVYHIHLEDNDYKCYLKEKKNRPDIEALSPTEFVAKHGEPPWILANEILASANMGYQFTTPEGQGRDDRFTAKLINQSSGVEISFSELSSGEKVIMALSLALYTAEDDSEYPEVLLLDEPDCHLHPSMAGKLLDVLNEVFVSRRGIKVIMTTHSPSTVALAQEENLYVMSKEAGRLSKQTKDRCIKTLTAGIPALSIKYENRIQVFVESKHDAKNYSSIYELLKDRLENDISLNFISSGAGGSGSSEQVQEIVSLMRKNGNGTVFGVIDWDGKRTCGDFVKVIAKGRRYSLENLILDPFLLALYLLRESLISPEKIGLSSRISYPMLGELSLPDRQKLAKYVVDELRENANIPTSRDFIMATYLDGSKLHHEDWYFNINGHDLEELAKLTFKPLNRFRGENDLKHDLIRKIMRDFPQFVPVEFYEVFRSLQTCHLD